DTMKRTIITAAILSLLTLPAWAGTIEGIDARARGEFTKALQEFRAGAENGDPAAQTLLGEMFERGEGTPRNFPEAAKWYLEAAKQDFAEAQVRLGTLYALGQGVTQDNEQAFAW